MRTGNASSAAKSGAVTKKTQVPNFAMFVYERARRAKGARQQDFFCPSVSVLRIGAKILFLSPCSDRAGHDHHR